MHPQWNHCVALIPAVLLSFAMFASTAMPQVLNEVLYDPANAAAGREFVEIFNETSQMVSLAGVKLEFANGAEPPHWSVRWTGTASDSIAAGGYFLIGDRGWPADPVADAVVSLSLQNGPDAIRLVLPDERIDLLGYGQLEFAELYEGEPAIPGSSGISLGRKPDGHDTNNNLADWWHLDGPTPGGQNFLRWQLGVAACKHEPPSQVVAGRPVTVTVVVDNLGLAMVSASEATLMVGSQQFPGWFPTLQPGARDTFETVWSPSVEGCFDVLLTVPVSGSTPDLVVQLGRYHVGVGSVYLNEVMAAPSAGCCEWIEVSTTDVGPVDLSGYLIRDQDGDWCNLPELVLEPQQRTVLVQDRAEYLQWRADVTGAGGSQTCDDSFPAEIHELPGSWPSLNNSAPTSRTFADRILLARSDMTVIDNVVLGAGDVDVPPGRSLERRTLVPLGLPAANWEVCKAALGGTPGCPNSVAASQILSPALILQPNPFDAGSSAGGTNTPLHVLFRVPTDQVGWDVRIFDLWGREVRDLGGDRLGPGARDLIWDGRNDQGQTVPPGGYIVLLRFFDAELRFSGGGKKLAIVAVDS